MRSLVLGGELAANPFDQSIAHSNPTLYPTQLILSFVNVSVSIFNIFYDKFRLSLTLTIIEKILFKMSRMSRSNQIGIRLSTSNSFHQRADGALTQRVRTASITWT